MDILTAILENLIKTDQALEKIDINSALKYTHESMVMIKEYKSTVNNPDS